jgi:UDP-glucose 4-epimerase
MSAILVTGGAGYIGSHVLKLLRNQKKKVVVIDNLSTGREEAILHGDLLHQDLNDCDKLEAAFEKYNFDSVIHFAGSIIVPESVDEPLKYYRNNYVNTLNLLDCCKKFKVKKFIFSSTAAVYGMNGSGLIEESTPTGPINPYGESKLMVEKCLRDLNISWPDFNFICLRYFNVSGADLELETGQVGVNSTHLIKVAMELLTEKRDKLEIFGNDYETKDGTCVRDYIHVMDLAQAHIDALRYLDKEKNSHILNCGYGVGFSVLEVVEEIKKLSKKKLNIVKAPRRAGDAASLVSSNKKIKELLHWEPQHNDIKTIVKSAYDWEKKLV